MLNIGVIGYGYWGPNIVRNFNAIDGAKVISLCDLNEAALGKARKLYPAIATASMSFADSTSFVSLLVAIAG